VTKQTNFRFAASKLDCFAVAGLRGRTTRWFAMTVWLFDMNQEKISKVAQSRRAAPWTLPTMFKQKLSTALLAPFAAPCEIAANL
jgi:hypothetical protein